MPATPNRPCRRCKRVLTTETYCQACAEIVQGQRQQYGNRDSASERGYDWKWFKVKEYKKMISPMCERCEQMARVKTADTIHHIIPLKERPDLRLAIDNLMSLCRDCHEEIHGRGRGVG